MHSEHKIIGDPSSSFEQMQRTDLRDFFGFLELTFKILTALSFPSFPSYPKEMLTSCCGSFTMRFLPLDCNLGVGDAFETLDTPDLVLERVFIVDSIMLKVAIRSKTKMTVLYWCVMVWEKHRFFPARDMCLRVCARGSSLVARSKFVNLKSVNLACDVSILE